MRSPRFAVGLALLVLALVSYLLGLTRFAFHIGGTEINVYLTALLALVGVGLIVRPGTNGDRRRRPG